MSEKVYGGFTQAELEEAFSLVQNPENWKRNINAVVENEAGLLARISAAVVYFTDSVAHTSPARGGKVRVKALGYYAVIGA